MKKINIILSSSLLFLLGVLSNNKGQAQNTEKITLNECYQLAEQNYPLVKQLELIEKSKSFTVSNTSKAALPQVNIAGQATYQSDVTSVPIKIPGTTIPTLDKDQYKLYAEVTQTLTDQYTIKQQKELQKSNSEVEIKRLEIELYKLKERVNQLYFGVLLINAQLNQTSILEKDIQSNLNKIKAALDNGVAIRSNVDQLSAELLKINQRKEELSANKMAYTEMLSAFTGKRFSESTLFVEPIVLQTSQAFNRTELKLYDAQINNLSIQQKITGTKSLPKVALFFQGGYGRPALNMLNNDFDTYYIGGLKMNWNISSYYTQKKEKSIISINQEILSKQKETFVFNSNLVLTQQDSEIKKYLNLMNTDKEIITLRERISKASNVQLENGTITMNDYISNVNAEDQAKQNLILHQIQYLMSQYNYNYTSGN